MTGTSASASPAVAPEKHTNGSRLLTPDELAERWQVSKAHIYRLAREGRIPVVRLGRYRRFRLADVEEFEAGGGEADG